VNWSWNVLFSIYLFSFGAIRICFLGFDAICFSQFQPCSLRLFIRVTKPDSWSISRSGLRDVPWISTASLGRYGLPAIGRLEVITHQPPKPSFRPRLPHQNFLDFSKSLENSKNLPDYREYSKYCEYHINFSILWRWGLQNPSWAERGFGRLVGDAF
jgi:hypothetical protein